MRKTKVSLTMILTESPGGGWGWPDWITSYPQTTERPKHTDCGGGWGRFLEKGGMKPGQTVFRRCPQDSIVHKWQSLDSGQGYFNQPASSAALPAPSPPPPAPQCVHSGYARNKSRRTQSYTVRVSLLILSSCHPVSFPIKPTGTPLQHSLHIPKHLFTWVTSTSRVCYFHFPGMEHRWFRDCNSFKPWRPQWRFHPPLRYPSALEFLFSFSSSASHLLPSFYFISLFLSPSILSQIEVTEVETIFLKGWVTWAIRWFKRVLLG